MPLHVGRRWESPFAGKQMATEAIKRHGHDLRAMQQPPFTEKLHPFKINPVELRKTMWNKLSQQAPRKQEAVISSNVLFSIKKIKNSAKLCPCASPRIDLWSLLTILQESVTIWWQSGNRSVSRQKWTSIRNEVQGISLTLVSISSQLYTSINTT